MKVWVERDSRIEKMFLNWGYKIVNIPEEADLICFTGGVDVSPMLYDSAPIIETISESERDAYCSAIWHSFPEKNFVGICRGAQFLHVMNGGVLYQHVEGHTQRHNMYLMEHFGRSIEVTSTHHQMMCIEVEAQDTRLLAAGKLKLKKKGHKNFKYNDKYPTLDPEVILYPETKTLCYQPHPEYVSRTNECQTYFFDLIREHLTCVELSE